MLKAITTIILAMLAYQLQFTTPANAQTCPDYYRFVDFGLKDSEGKIYRGGTVLRAEGFSTQALLLEEKTQCLDVNDVAKDGHGNPIPVVKSVHYDPEEIGITLKEVKLFSVKDSNLVAEQNALEHQNNLKNPRSKKVRGTNFICANIEETKALSCQLVSPYPGNKPLVIYCDQTLCRLPAMAINEELIVSASWERDKSLLDTMEKAGKDFFTKIQKIHDFLKPLSAAL